MPKDLIIRGGTVYDPACGIDGEKKDILVSGGRIAEKIREDKAEVIDASGKIVFPAGVDIHSHFAGGKVNMGRLMRPEDSRGNEYAAEDGGRSGSGRSLPTTYLTGRLYAKMGYSFAVEPAVPPLKARHTHEEFNETPVLDRLGLLLMGNNHQAIEYVSKGDRESLNSFVAYMIAATKTYGVKAVNPGGVFAWGWGKNVEALDDSVPHYQVTPKEIIEGLISACSELKLPHPLHLHTNNLGTPGNYETTKETLKLGAMHVTHLQFSSYGGESWKDFRSEAEKVAEEVNRRKDVTADLGQVCFGDTTTMTGDSPFEYHLALLSKNKWSNMDSENESGGGIAPYEYKQTSAVNSVQWAVGLELALHIKDPWKVYLSTDHPNAAPFTNYPKVIAWLMDKKHRDETLAGCHRWASDRTSLASIGRELSLYEIAIMSRAGPAKRLGFKADLSAGAPASLAVYDLDPEKADGKKVERAFSCAEYLVKDGEAVVWKGRLADIAQGKTLWCNPKQEKDIEEDIRERFKYYTVELENFAVEKEYLPRSQEVKTG